jgi:hypothetical protein
MSAVSHNNSYGYNSSAGANGGGSGAVGGLGHSGSGSSGSSSSYNNHSNFGHHNSGSKEKDFNIVAADQMVGEYLIFRGFTQSFRSLEAERSRDKTKHFEAVRIVDVSTYNFCVRLTARLVYRAGHV